MVDSSYLVVVSLKPGPRSDFERAHPSFNRRLGQGWGEGSAVEP